MLNTSFLGQSGGDTGQVITGFNYPAAVGGLNRRDAKAAMPIEDANILDNLIPRPNWVELRRGHESYATGMTGQIRTLMEWAGPSSRKFFAVNGGNIYDITNSGAVGAADVSGLNTSDWQHINMATSGGNFLLAVSGSDSPRNYNGTAWATTPAITGSGLTASDLIDLTLWKSRVILVERNTKNAWYLPVNSIGGSASKIDLGPQFKRGGYLLTVNTFSYDAGNGPDDYLAFISDLGEVAVYQGTDPSTAQTFSLVGKFELGTPIGRRCTKKVGGDLAVITVDGVVSLIKMMQLDRSAAQRAAITNKIQQLFNEYARDYRANFGWQCEVYPKASLALFNVPFSTTQQVQLVMNTDTGSWCRFTGWNGTCLGLYNDELYFGGNNGVVYKADSTLQDNGGIIPFDYQGAYTNFGIKGRFKIFQLIKSLIVSSGSPSLLQAMNTDFADVEPTGTLSPSAPQSSVWGTAQWGTGVWSGDNAFFQPASVGAIGEYGAVRIKGAANGISLQFNAFTVDFTAGGFL